MGTSTQSSRQGEWKLPLGRSAPTSIFERHIFGHSASISKNVASDSLTQGHSDMYKDVHGGLICSWESLGTIQMSISEGQAE